MTSSWKSEASLITGNSPYHTYNKECLNAPHNWPLVGLTIYSPHKGPVMRSTFPHHWFKMMAIPIPITLISFACENNLWHKIIFIFDEAKVNVLSLTDATMHQSTQTTLIKVTVRDLTAKRQYLNHGWHIITLSMTPAINLYLQTICLDTSEIAHGQISFTHNRTGTVRFTRYIMDHSFVTVTLAPRLFTQTFVQLQIKENIKAPRHWPLWIYR